jgi:cytochrome c-type biogenesis protein CcmH/NrfF
MTENLEIGNWLLQQSPVIIVMGIVIWWLAKRLEKAQDEKDVLSRDVIKITTLWEEKASDSKDEEIIKLLTEIKGIVSSK